MPRCLDLPASMYSFWLSDHLAMLTARLGSTSTSRPLALLHARSSLLVLRPLQRRLLPLPPAPPDTIALMSMASQYTCVLWKRILTHNMNSCETNVLAYTLPSLNVIANCDIYYSYLPALTGTCHSQDQATTTLHELTHAPGVLVPYLRAIGHFWRMY